MLDTQIKSAKWSTRAIITLAVSLLIAPAVVSANELEISAAEKSCREVYPDWTDFFDRRECVEKATSAIRKRIQEDKRREAKEKREADARECISNDLPRMEAAYVKIFDAVEQEFQATLNDKDGGDISSDQIEKILKATITDIFIQKVSSNDNIRQKVLVSTVRTKCNSDFHFLLNIRLDESGNVSWLRGWSETPPTGYKDPIVNSRGYLSYQAMQESARAKKAEAKKKADEEALKEKEKKIEAERLMQARSEFLNKVAEVGSPGFTADQNGCRLWNSSPRKAEKVTWSGGCTDGLAHDFGTARWTAIEGGKSKTQIVTAFFVDGFQKDGVFEIINPDGEKTKGQIKNGAYDGRIQVWTGENQLIVDVNYNDGKKVGYGFFTYTNKTRYEGWFVNDLESGQGTIFRADGSIWYQGSFKNGKRDGFGKLFVQNHRYEGYFADGLGNGKGIWFMPDSNGQMTQIEVKAKNDCLWRYNITFFHTLSTEEAKCKIDGYPY